MRRSLWFIARKLLILTLVAGLLTLVFYLCMNLANINILLQDGMSERAAMALKLQEDESSLPLYFTDAFIENDDVLRQARQGSGQYRDYTIRDFDHRTELQWFWCWPWENNARARFLERLPYIDGELPYDLMSDEQKEAGVIVAPPAWPNILYEVELVREDARWKISALRILSSEMPEALYPTQTPAPSEEAAA